MTAISLAALFRVGIRASLSFALIGASYASAVAEDSAISARRTAERKSFTDQQIITGFFKVAFHNDELPITGAVDRIRKYVSPIRVYIDNRAKSERAEKVAAVVADIASRIQNLDIAVTAKRSEANLTVALVHDRDFPRAVRALNARKRVNVQRSLQPKCLSEFSRDNGFRIVRSDVILVADAEEFTLQDCTYEEVLKALGPINDDSTVPWTMFNDEVQMGFFTIYDQYLLNILYDRRIRPGMTRAEVRTVLPEILPSVRAWVAKTNKLPLAR